MEEILERQLLIRGRAVSTFSTIKKTLAGRKKSFCGLRTALGRMLCRPHSIKEVFVKWYGLFDHFCDLNHEITRMQQEELQ